MTRIPQSYTHKDPAELDALLADRQNDWWNTFYANRAKPVPFFGTAPDESLSTWINDGVFPPGKALDLGCGNGRNAILLAKSGFSVDGVEDRKSVV